MDQLPEKHSRVEISFGYGNKMITVAGLVSEVNNNEIVLDLDAGDNTVTLSPGTDMYLKGGGLYNVLDAAEFPRVRIEKVHERLHARVDDVLKVDYRKVSLEEGTDECGPSPEIILESVFGEPQTIPEVETISLEMLYKLLYQLNQKVDRLMDIMDRQDREPFKTTLPGQVNISAAGIRLNLPEALTPGELVALRIALPLETATRLQALGTVVASVYDESRNEYRISLKFLDLSEDMKETVTRYVFKRQRELLRK